MDDVGRTVDALWRIEGARVVGMLARMTGDVGLAEDLAQEAIVDALTQWPESGVPRNGGAWLMAVAKRRAIDGWRRREALDERYRAMARQMPEAHDMEWEPIDDDVLRLVFTTCHPALTREAQVTLTLRIAGSLSTHEISRLLLIPVATVQQRIVRAKKALSIAKVPIEAPDPGDCGSRLGAVLAVVHLIFTEGYAATSGDRWIRPELANEALRMGRRIAVLLPSEPEVHGLLALMEIQSSRFAARVASDGSPILLADQNRSRWDHAQIRRGRAALRSAGGVDRGLGAYGLQATIAECHAVAPSTATTDWHRIVSCYDALGRLTPGPIVELNRAVAVSMATGPANGLAIVDDLVQRGALPGSHLLPSVRGELLAQLGQTDEAVTELLAAAALAGNERQAAVLRTKAAALWCP